MDLKVYVEPDESMTRIVHSGTASAEPAWAYSARVEVQGLEPDRWYWYRFRAGEAQSVVGRTRTAPAPGASPQRLRFAFASCQQFEQGNFGATPAVDALIIVADHTQVSMLLTEQVHQLKLRGVGVLVFVHHHEAESLPAGGQDVRPALR